MTAVTDIAFLMKYPCSGYGAPAPQVSHKIGYAAPAPQVANRLAGGPQSSLTAVRTELEKPKVALRNFFPENWLFELTNVNENTLER